MSIFFHGWKRFLFHRRRRQQQSRARGSEIGGPKKQATASPLCSLSCLAVILPRHLSVLLLSQVESNMVGQHTRTHTNRRPTFLGRPQKNLPPIKIHDILWRREKDLGLGVGDACSANELIFAVVVLHKHALCVFM